MNIRPVGLFAVGVLWLSVSAAFGITLVPVSDEALADAADSIVHVRVTSATVVETTHSIVTRYRAEPLRAIKGSGDRVTFDLPGGTLENGRRLWVPGVPAFAIGDQLLLFLERTAGGAIRPLFGVQGIFSRRGSGTDEAWLRIGARESVVVLGSEAIYRAARDGGRFTEWLSDRSRGLLRPPDYRLAPSPSPPAPPPAGAPIGKFTLRQPLIRWTDFDDGGTASWFWVVPPGAGDVSGPLDDFRTARQLWNRAPGARVRMIPGGPRNSMSTRDSVSTVTFEDPNNVLGGTFDCNRGGVLSGLFIVFDPATRPWKGKDFARAIAADFVFNQGTSCRLGRLFDQDRRFARDLGRILGLDFSCGGTSRRPCVEGTPEGDAVMSAVTFGLDRPLALSSDDVDGIRYLYDPQFTAVDPTPRCPWRPGHPRFCTDCGPCTRRLGDCDRDSECAPGLVCVNDRGADFGFAPGIDVCLGGNIPDEPRCTLGSGRFCTDCGPCASGQGDCDSDSECAPGLECVDNVGGQFGFAPGVDVCLPGGPPPMCTSTVGRGDFCSTPGCGPCGVGEGDCDSDAECAPGLRCVEDIGPRFGFGARVDVCQ